VEKEKKFLFDEDLPITVEVAKEEENENRLLVESDQTNSMLSASNELNDKLQRSSLQFDYLVNKDLQQLGQVLNVVTTPHSGVQLQEICKQLVDVLESLKETNRQFKEGLSQFNNFLVKFPETISNSQIQLSTMDSSTQTIPPRLTTTSTSLHIDPVPIPLSFSLLSPIPPSDLCSSSSSSSSTHLSTSIPRLISPPSFPSSSSTTDEEQLLSSRDITIRNLGGSLPLHLITSSKANVNDDKDETKEHVNLTIANTGSVLSPTPSVDSNDSESDIEHDDLGDETQHDDVNPPSSSASFSSSSSSSSSASTSFISAITPPPENFITSTETPVSVEPVKEDKNIDELNDEKEIDDIDDQKQDDLQGSWTSLTREDIEKLDKLEALGGIYACRPFNAVLFDLYHDVDKVKAALDQFHKVKS